MSRRQHYVYSYDIVCDRRRKRFSDRLLNYAVRVQFSVFEAVITNKQHETLLEDCLKELCMKEDSLKIYCLPHATEKRIFHFGQQKVYEGEKGIVI